MKLLAVDTSTEQCSVALYAGDACIERRVLTARGHAELVLPMIEEVLAESGCTLASLDGLAFGRGPGAFTGVRIAVGVVQGISLGSGLPVVGVSTLAAVARQATVRGDAALVCMDARMNEVYWGAFAPDPLSGVVALLPERVGSPASVEWPGSGVRAGVGTGFRAHPELMTRFQFLAIDASALPRASDIAVLGKLALQRGEGVHAADAQPVYLRDQVAWVKSQPGP